MVFIVVVFFILSLAALDNSIASLALSAVMYAIGIIMILSMCQKKSRRVYFRLYNIIFLVYFGFAFLVSASFSVSDNFIVTDSSQYIESYMSKTYLTWDEKDLINCYAGFGDNNFLYNIYLNGMAMFANKYLGGMTVFGLTICQTIWGALSSLVLFRILSRRFNLKKAFQYTLLFAVCSQFMFYSTVIIRDIIICFFYLCAFDIVDQKFSVAGIFKLLLIVVIIWGIRLYSALFAISFIVYYIYRKCRKSSFRHISASILVIILIFAITSSIGSSLMEQTATELDEYEKLSAERSSGGIVSKLQSLPPGVSHMAIVFMTMIKPLPPLDIYTGANTFSQFAMSTMYLVAGFFWFVVFYSLCYYLFVRKYILKIPVDRIILLSMCLVFLLANAAHPDIRRMMPVFPIFFLQFAEICRSKKVSLFGSKISKKLIRFYIVVALIMLI